MMEWALDLVFDENNEDELLFHRSRRLRWIREREELFDTLDDIDFIRRFRLTKPTVLTVLEAIEDKLDFHSYMNLRIICMGVFFWTFCVMNARGQHNHPDIEYEHDPRQTWPERVNNGTTVPGDQPDFRVEEDTWYAHVGHFYKEENRPYRMSPFFKQATKWRNSQSHWHYDKKEFPGMVGCQCTTVYKRLTNLASCVVLTTRHILTSATSTELVLQYPHNGTVDHILGAWYDVDEDSFNSSVYIAPSRIHYHPRYLHPHQVNHTHPLPISYDLAVWATLYTMRNDGSISKVMICDRGGPHRWQYLSSTPRYWDMAHVVGFQFIKAFRKRPLPWFKYVIRTRAHTVPCPKTDWGWMHCIPGRMWARYGLEQGAGWFRNLEGRYWLWDGLIGMCILSMNLRTTELTHYFIVLNTHPVLDFMYASYMGLLPYRFLDNRFYDTQNKAPRPHSPLPNYDQKGIQHYQDDSYGNVLPFY